jgi:hypothetical protein
MELQKDGVQDDMIKMRVQKWRIKAMDRGEYVRWPRLFNNCRAMEEEEEEEEEEKKKKVKIKYT